MSTIGAKTSLCAAVCPFGYLWQLTDLGDGQIAQNHSSANMSQKTKDKIFNNDLWGLQAADLAAFSVTGQDIDSGTAAEIWFFCNWQACHCSFRVRTQIS